MNDLTNISGVPLAMSSREIAELTGKRHDNVMADIRKMLVELHGGNGTTEFSGVYKDQQLIDRPCFNLPKRETLILVSGYSVAMRAKIIDRWQELEAKAAAPTLSPANLSRLQLIELAMQAEQERLKEVAARERLELKVEEQQPKVEAFDLLGKSETDYTITQAAKILNVAPYKRLFAWMNENKWIYKHAGRGPWLPHREFINKGLMVLSTSATPITHTDGRVESPPQARITAKGMAHLGLIFSNHAAANVKKPSSGQLPLH